MVVIKRLLEYTFPDTSSAIRELRNRGVRGIQSWGVSTIAESFYYDSQDAIDVLNMVVTPCVKGEPPDGAR